MTIGVTFGEIIEQVRAEARLSSNTSRGIDALEIIRQVIRRNYTMLAEDFDWEHLRLRRDQATKAIEAGSRDYDFPDSLNVQKISKAWIFWGNQWEELKFGIDAENYNAQNPDSNQRSDPVTHWDFVSHPSGVPQFEVWPLPASDSTIGFEGQRAITPLVVDGDRASLDDRLIALSSAAEMCTGDEKLYERLTGMAAERKRQLRAGLADKTRIRVGMGQRQSSRPRGDITYIGRRNV